MRSPVPANPWGNVRLKRTVTSNPISLAEFDSSIAWLNSVTAWLDYVATAFTEGVCCVAFSPDSMTLASGHSDGTIKLWNARTGLGIRTLRWHIFRVHSVAFSPDSMTLASGSWDRTLKIWRRKSNTDMRCEYINVRG